MVRCNLTTACRSGAALFSTAGFLALGSIAQAQTNVKTATLTPEAAEQLTQVSHAGIPAGTASYAELLAVDAGAQDKTVAIAGRDYPFAIRLGAMVSPRIKFVGGADVTFPRYGIAPNWVGRVDAEAIVSANLGGNSTLIPLTFDQVYFFPQKIGSLRPYAGLGIGPYFASSTRFGGKFFVGSRLTDRLSGEAAVHFSGQGDALLILEARGAF